MEWHMMNMYGTHTFSDNIGYYLDGTYLIADECEDTLLEVLDKLNTEDPVSRQFRRQLALMEIIQGDLVPLLIHLDPTEDANIFCTLLQTFFSCGLGKMLLSLLTLPQWSISIEEKKYGLCSSRSTISDKASNDFSMDDFDCESLKGCDNAETSYHWDAGGSDITDLDQDEERKGLWENDEPVNEDSSSQKSLPELVSIIKLMESSLFLGNCHNEREVNTISPPGGQLTRDNYTDFSDDSTSEELKILQDEIRIVLIEFTQEFLQKGFSQIVISLLFTIEEMNEVLSSKPEQMTDIIGGCEELDTDSSALNKSCSIPKVLWPALIHQLNSQV